MSSRRCEQLRETALEQGLDSRAGLVWRVHARSCEDCRMELEILEALRRQALRERSHLGRDDVDLLLSQVRRMREEHNRRAPRFLRATATLAACVAALFTLGLLAPYWMASGDRLPRGSGDAGHWTDSLASAGSTTVLPAAAQHAVPDAAARQAGATTTPDAPEHNLRPQPSSCEERIRDLQERLDERRNRLLHLIEYELGDPNDQDAFDLPEDRDDVALV